MYSNTIQVGEDFEVQVFGPGGNHKLKGQVYGPDEFSRAARDFLFYAGPEDISRTDTAQLICFYVRKYLKSLHLQVEAICLYSARGSKLDRFFGVDALLVVKIDGVDHVATLDAYAAKRHEIEAEKNESGCYREFQSRVYALKLGKLLKGLSSGSNRWRYTESLLKKGRPLNYFLVIPDDIRRPRGLKELSRNIAVSIWQQVNTGVDLRYCSISGFTRPVAT